MRKKQKPPVQLKKRIKIVVGINSLTNTLYESYTNHIQFFFRLGRLYPHIDFALVNPARMSIDRMRQLTARTALDIGADYLLFVDDDILVESEGLQQLIDCNADIAAGKVVIRGYPFDWMIFKRKGDNLFSCKTLPERGVDPCDAVGFSFCLIKVSLLQKIPTGNQPYFVTGLNNTEDIYFCVRARQADPKCTIVCACDTLCGHILWPEVMDSRNRAAYTKYYEEMNPHVKKQYKEEEQKKKKNHRGDRGLEYLRNVEEVISEKGLANVTIIKTTEEDVD